MSRHNMTRAKRDAQNKAAIEKIPKSGVTVQEMQDLLGDDNRCNVRLKMDRWEYHRVLIVNRADRPNRYKPAPDWEVKLDDYVTWRDKRNPYTQKKPKPILEDRAPGVAIVAHAIKHQPTSVWALGSRSYAS